VFEQTIELLDLPKGRPAQGRILAELNEAHDVLRGEVWVELTGRPAPRNALVEAEAFSAEGGGHVQIRPLKDAGGRKVVTAWDQKGHFLEWSIDLPAAGRYPLLLRYHATDKVTRRLLLNGADLGPIAFLATRGSGADREHWDEVTFMDCEGKPFQLQRGRQTIHLENVDAHALDVDYLGFGR